MPSAAAKIEQLEKLRQELLKSCEDSLFEVHHGPPSFWNSDLDSKLEDYLSSHSSCTYSTCPVCGHKIKAPQFSSDFNDPWWMYPQKAFSQSEACQHLEILTFSILWTHSEPLGPPWILPCGWGVPALSESLVQNDNLLVSVKTSQLPNGATIFWMGLYRHQAGLPIYSDFWPLPLLKTRSHIRPSLNSRGYWGEFSTLTIHSPLVWSKLYLEQEDGSLHNYETKKDTGAWLQRLRAWSQFAYTQPMKMCNDRFVAESGFASFAIGMRSSRSRGAFFISQTPIFANYPTVVKARPVEPVRTPSLPHVHKLSIEKMRELGSTDSLWAIIDPFQNEASQDWLRLIKKNPDAIVIPLWSEAQFEASWHLTADSSHTTSINSTSLVEFYRDLSPLLVKITADILELSYRYPLGSQSWGAFFISHQPVDKIHSHLRKNLICNYQSHWVYFRFYETNFLTVALSVLHNSDLQYFYGPITGWIFRNRIDSDYTLFTTTDRDLSNLPLDTQVSNYLPKSIHETAQRVFHFDLPRRIKEFIKDRTPEFSDLIPSPVIDRWIRESVRQANHWNIKKEAHQIKFFLWKVLITPAWCHLSPFVRILQQPVAEEVKIQNIENLFPQLRLSEIPRGLTIEAWDSELWVELRKFHSPLGNADPEAFHPSLGEKPPAMPLNNPNWLKTLGLFYESAYGDLQSQSGVHLLDSVFEKELLRPLHAPPRLLTLSSNEIVIRDEGHRSHAWLKDHGFEFLASTQGNWIYRTSSLKQIILVARLFLEEFPYVDSKYIFDFLGAAERAALTSNLELYAVTWDSHHFWLTKPL